MADPATYLDYLDIEVTTGLRHEFLDGEIVAMAGGTPSHAELAGRTRDVLVAATRGKPCKVYPSDLKVRVLDSGLATYADVTVVCGPLELHPEDPNAVTNPSVLVEVLSPSTEAYDRGLKFAHYRRITSLQDYLLVASDRVSIDHYARGAGGSWSLRSFGPGEHLTLTDGGEVSVDMIYSGVDLALPRPLRLAEPR